MFLKYDNFNLLKTMGNCVKEGKIVSSKGPIKLEYKQAEGRSDTNIEIINETLSTVRLNHTPLQSCEYLYDKFSHSSSKP